MEELRKLTRYVHAYWALSAGTQAAEVGDDVEAQLLLQLPAASDELV